MTSTTIIPPPQLPDPSMPVRDRPDPGNSAGITLPAVHPEVMGYTKIAALASSTGLYTMLIPDILLAFSALSTCGGGRFSNSGDPC